MVVERNGEALFRTTDFVVEIGDGDASGYPIPTRLQIRGKDVEGTIETGPILVRANPLENIPQPFRFLLSFKMNPRRVWTRSSFELTLRVAPDLPAIALKGSGVTTVTYLNPLPKTTPRSLATGKSGA